MMNKWEKEKHTKIKKEIISRNKPAMVLVTILKQAV